MCLIENHKNVNVTKSRSEKTIATKKNVIKIHKTDELLKKKTIKKQFTKR
jgi:hypothetical protein